MGRKKKNDVVVTANVIEDEFLDYDGPVYLGNGAWSDAAAVSTALDEVDTEPCVRRISREMTMEERAKAGRELADSLVEVEEARGALSIAAEDYRARKKQLAKDLAEALKHSLELGQAVRLGSIGTEPVDCTLTKNYRLGTVVVTRNDTGETIEDRPMALHERQRTLPIVDGPVDDGEDEDGDDWRHLQSRDGV